jgi:hypothetical protein
VGIALVAAFSYHTYSFTISVTESGGFHNQSFPLGSHVSGRWYADGSSLILEILTSGGTEIYEGQGYSGSFSFTADASSYHFYAIPTLAIVSVTGSYWAPL